MIEIGIFKDCQSFYWRMKHTADKTVAFQKLWNSYLVVECISGTFSSFCLYEIFDIFSDEKRPSIKFDEMFESKQTFDPAATGWNYSWHGIGDYHSLQLGGETFCQKIL